MGWMETDEPNEFDIDRAADEAHRLVHPYCEGCGDELCKRAEICLCGNDKACLLGDDKLPYCHDCADEEAASGEYHGEFVNSDPVLDAKIRVIRDGILKLNMSGVHVTQEQAEERARNIATSLQFV